MTRHTSDILPKRTQIIEAAVAEFQENGFALTSMDRISKRAEVSKRTVYKHFESKENLFRSIVGILSERVADALDVQYVPGRPIRDQLTELAWADGQLLMSPEVMAMSRMMISETLRSPELAEAAQGQVDSHSKIAAWFKEAKRDGALRIDDPATITDEFLGLLKARAFWPVIFGAPIMTRDELAKVVDETVDMLMCRYGTP